MLPTNSVMDEYQMIFEDADFLPLILNPNFSFTIPPFNRPPLPELDQSDWGHKQSGFCKLRFTEPIPPEYCCAICLEVVRHPLECKFCGCLYCYKCSPARHQLHLNPPKKFPCKSCDTFVVLQEPSRLLKNIIGEFRIKCKFSCCDFVGVLSEIESHEENCEYREIVCWYSGCRRKGLMRDYIRVNKKVYSLKERYVCSKSCKENFEFAYFLQNHQEDLAVKKFFKLINKKSLEENGGSRLR